MTALIVDAGPLYSYVDVRDDYHEPCLKLLSDHAGPLIVPMLVITEVAYLLATRLDHVAEARFLGDLAAGNFLPEPVHPADWLRIAELVTRYSDLRLGTVDASVIVVAERLGINQIATVDHRHFSVVRPQGIDQLELLPTI